jgi:hypothetical protein
MCLAATTLVEASLFTESGAYYDYQGTVGSGLGVQMSIYIKGSEVNGAYFYEKYGRELTLKGHVDGNKINMTEYAYTRVTGVFTGVLQTVDAINAAIDTAIKEGITKFGGKIPNKAALKTPLRDGDTERDDEAYKDAYFVNANSKTAPQIVDRDVKPIIDRNEVYSGCYARVSLTFYAFNSNGNRGIACGLGNIQKIRDGESLGGGYTAEQDFTTAPDDDFLG